jgi:hypothetical protein
VILLHRFVRDNLQQPPSCVRNGDNLDRIHKCMSVLNHCGSVGPIASKFEQTLRPFYATLRTAYDKPSSRSVSNLKKMEGGLCRLVLLPPRHPIVSGRMTVRATSRWNWGCAAQPCRLGGLRQVDSGPSADYCPLCLQACWSCR